MKERFRIFVPVLLCAALITACAQTEMKSSFENSSDQGQKVKVVTTIFPVYDWIREIVGEDRTGMELTLLSEKGADMHSYLPTAADMLRISECDLLVCTGGESEKWMEDVLQNNVKKEIRVLKLTDMVGDNIKKEEDDHKEGHAEHKEQDEEAYDEHVWLSLKNAELCVEEIAGSLCAMRPSGETNYRENAQHYLQKLEEMDRAYQFVVDQSVKKTLIICDRFPFLYMMKDYGIEYYAAFPGCSTETDASFETVTFMADKVKEQKSDTVLVIEDSDKRLAKTVLEYAAVEDGRILELDSMQSVSLAESEQGLTYLSVMSRNLDVLREALK